MDAALLTRFQNWYLTNCNGDWEHSFGVKLYTVDNPGWFLEIDLAETCLDKLEYDLKIDNSEDDWFFIKVEEQTLKASGDPRKLTTILTIFLDEIIPKYADPKFEYEVYVELFGGPIKMWREAKAKMVSEDTLQITELPDLKSAELRFLEEPDCTIDEILKYETTTRLYEGSFTKVQLQVTWSGMTLIAKE